MKKFMAKKLLTIALVGVRRICEHEDLDFMKLVAKSVKSEMTFNEVEYFIDNFKEDETE
jgi:hypothetical protein